MLRKRRRRWHNIKSTLAQSICRILTTGERPPQIRNRPTGGRPGAGGRVVGPVYRCPVCTDADCHPAAAKIPPRYTKTAASCSGPCYSVRCEILVVSPDVLFLAACRSTTQIHLQKLQNRILKTFE